MRYRVEREYPTLGWLLVVETDHYAKASATCDLVRHAYERPVRLVDTTRDANLQDPVVLEIRP